MLIYAALIVLVMLGYFYFKGSIGDSGFSYGQDSIYINSRNLRLDYVDILKVERDLGLRTFGGVMSFPRLITYKDQNDKIRSIRFYLSMTDQAKWEEFKVKLRAKNPGAMINESFL